MKKVLYTPEQAVLQEMLVSARIKAGLSQVHLSEIIKEPQSFVSKYETGARMLNIIQLIAILKSLGVEPDLFIKELSQRINIDAILS